MPIYALGDRVPQIHEDAYIHPDAVVIGDVRIGADSSVWPTAVLRGDYGTIIVGERTSIQDGTVVHAVDEYPTVIGNDCVIGHLAHLEGCTVEDRALVGSGSIVLHQAVVHSGAIVGDYIAGNSAGGQGGLGFLTIIYSSQFQMGALFATAAVGCLLGFIFVAGVIALSWLALHKWHDSFSRSDA